jgi:hypothetical protein
MTTTTKRPVANSNARLEVAALAVVKDQEERLLILEVIVEEHDIVVGQLRRAVDAHLPPDGLALLLRVQIPAMANI